MVVFDDTFYVAQVAFSKSTFAFTPDGDEPELRFISAFSYMNVRRLVGYVRFVEKEIVAIHAKDDRHG
ncbi:MAG TPA: hypothetical protein VMN99_15335, partial [Anaerolineales bacterium]|nr:hypothetical protein [Anaerolineales bacterium]